MKIAHEGTTIICESESHLLSQKLLLPPIGMRLFQRPADSSPQISSTTRVNRGILGFYMGESDIIIYFDGRMRKYSGRSGVMTTRRKMAAAAQPQDRADILERPDGGPAAAGVQSRGKRGTEFCPQAATDTSGTHRVKAAASIWVKLLRVRQWSRCTAYTLTPSYI